MSQCKCCTYDFLQVVSYLFTKLLVICSIVIDYFINELPPVVEKVDSTIHWINLYKVDKVIGFFNKYPLDSDFPVDSAIQPLNDRGLLKESLSFVG